MKTEQRKLVVIGGGIAGLCAAVAARRCGVDDVLIIEREHTVGGIMNQCGQKAFGHKYFGESMTGPAYAKRCADEAAKLAIPIYTDVSVRSVDSENRILCVGRERGVFTVQAAAILLATGCRERPVGAYQIPGYRATGIYTVGTAQRFLEIDRFLPGKNVIIYGVDRIGLAVAQRLRQQGAQVCFVSEKVQREIAAGDSGSFAVHSPRRVLRLLGSERVEGIVTAALDENGAVLPNSEQEITCDTFLTAGNLLPENELARRMGAEIEAGTGHTLTRENFASTTRPGLFLCGNVHRIHTTADTISEEAEAAGRCAAAYVMEKGWGT